MAGTIPIKRFLNVFGLPVHVVTGRAQGRIFEAVYERRPDDITTGKMRLARKTALLVAETREVEGIALEDELVVGNSRYAVVRIDTDEDDAATLYLDGDL